MRRWHISVVHFLIAAGILFILLPFVPGGALLQLESLTVSSDGRATLTRTVTLTHTGDYNIEVTNGHVRPECNRSDNTIFERREGRPVEWDIECSPPPGEYLVTFCVSPDGPFGIKMATTCVSGDWVVGREGD
jgi:hypothetical protein